MLANTSLAADERHLWLFEYTELTTVALDRQSCDDLSSFAFGSILMPGVADFDRFHHRQLDGRVLRRRLVL